MIHASTYQSQSDTQISTNDGHSQEGSFISSKKYEADRQLSEHTVSESEPSILGAAVRMTVSLLMVLALIAFGVFLLKKITPYKGFASNVKNPILVLSKIPLGQKKSICLVKIADEILVIGMTNSNMSLLSKLNAEDYYQEHSKDAYSISESGYKHSFHKLLGKIDVWNRKTSSAPPP